MSPLWSNALVFVGLVALCAVLVWQMRRAIRHEARHRQFLREQAEAVREVAELERLYKRDAYDPAWDAGLERLWDAVRDAQQKEADDA